LIKLKGIPKINFIFNLALEKVVFVWWEELLFHWNCLGQEEWPAVQDTFSDP